MKILLLSFAALALVASGSVFAMEKNNSTQNKLKGTAFFESEINRREERINRRNKRIKRQNRKIKRLSYVGSTAAAFVAIEGSCELCQNINEQIKQEKTKIEIATNILKNKKLALIKVLGGGISFFYCITR